MSTTTMTPYPGEITKLLIDWENGDTAAMNRLIPLVVEELRRIAARALAKNQRKITLQATELVNHIYLRLAGQKRARWDSRRQFFGTCTKFVKQMLVDEARKKAAICHGGGAIKVPLEEGTIDLANAAVSVGDGSYVDLIDLNNALERLSEFDPVAAEIIEHRFFAGMTIRETAAIMDVCTMTVSRDWKIAKMWLFRELDSKSARICP